MAQINIARSRVGKDLRRSWAIKIDDLDYSPQFSGDWSVTHSAEESFASGTFPVVKPFVLSAGRHRITLYAGWMGQVELAFAGEIVAKSTSYFLPGQVLSAGGYLRRTNEGLDRAVAFYYAGGSADDTQSLLDQIDISYQAVPITTDADIVIFILEAYGITPGTTNHSIEASSWTPAKLVPIFWEPGTPGWSIISEIDSITTYRTFDGRTGAVYRRRVLGTVPSNVKHTFGQGQDILPETSYDENYEIFNQVIVRGALIESTDEQVEGVSPVGGPVTSPYIPTPPGVRTDDALQSEYIETVPDAQALADTRLGLLKQPLQAMNLHTWMCADYDVGDALGVACSIYTGNAFAIAHTKTSFYSYFRLRVSTVAEARPNQPPIPAMTITTLREHLYVAGTLQPVTLITVDASASSDSDGTVVGYSIAIGGTTYPVPRVTHVWVGAPPATVTLTVTDDGGLQASLSQQVTWQDSEMIVEPIALAEGERGELSIDGEATWREFTGAVTSVAPIALGGTTLFGGSGGQIWRTTDRLETTPPTLAATLPAKVNCLWCNEAKTDRWLAGLDNGAVYLSIDDGLTWTNLVTFPAAVNDISESPFAPGQMQACSGSSYVTTFDGLTWTPQITRGGATALRFCAGIGDDGISRAFVGWSDGAIVTTDGQELWLPIAAQITGLTRAVLREEVYVFTDSTATWRWTSALGFQSGPATGSPTNRAIRSGEGEFSYVATDLSLQKWFPYGQCYDVRIM